MSFGRGERGVKDVGGRESGVGREKNKTRVHVYLQILMFHFPLYFVTIATRGNAEATWNIRTVDCTLSYRLYFTFPPSSSHSTNATRTGVRESGEAMRVPILY